jgi:hypothetical protein
MTVWGPGQARGKGEVRKFPHPLLAFSKGAAEAPAAVLGSLPLALLEVFATASLTPLGAYHRLRDLGASGRDHAYEAYETLNQELLDWVEEGRLLPDAPIPAARAGTASDTSETRRVKILTQLELWREGYKKEFEQQEGSGNPFSVTRDYELRHDILEALTDLVDALVASAHRGDGGFE